MFEEYQKHENEIKQSDKELKELSKECNQFTNKYERDEFLQAIIIETKNQMDQCIDEFQKSFTQLMVADSYCLYIKLQKKSV